MSVEGEDNLPSPVSVPPEPVAGHPFVATETKLTPTPTPTPIPISASDANPGHLGGQYAYAAELEAAPVPTSAPVTDPGHLGGQSADATEADPTPVLIPAPAPNLGPVGGQLGGAIEADEREELENDSAFGDDASETSSRTSLASGVKKYRIENGRRYHAYRDGVYLLPNDETEQDRLDLHHHVFCLASGGKLFHAPIEKPGRVLDAGTGTGIWAIDFADKFPGAHVIGSDLSPIQPPWIPPNLEFEVDDIEDVWSRKPFTFIHMRSLAGAIQDWTKLLTQAYAHLEPGGYLEVTEFEVWVYDQHDEYPYYYVETERAEMHMIKQWQEGLMEASHRIGRRFDVTVHLKHWLEDVGFEEVVESVTRVPATPWPKGRRQKEIGLYQQQNMLDASSSYGQAHFTRVLGWSKEEYEILSAGVRRELKDLRLQLYSNLYAVYGRKPGGKDQNADEPEEAVH